MTPTLLAIETATDICSVALAQGSRILAERTLRRPRVHAEMLTPLLQDVLRHGQVSVQAVDAIAVSSGPGSYTGLRIGVSTAKGLAMAVGASLIGVPSLEALAASVVPQAHPGDAICAVFNSRRHEVYAALFEVDDARELLPLADTAALTLEALPAWLDAATGRHLWVVGEGVPRVAPLLGAPPRQPYHLLGDPSYAPSAGWVARRAWPRLDAGMKEDVATFEPFYLKTFVADKPRRSAFEKLTF